MRKLVTAVVLIPLAVIIVMFAVANRETVTVSFDPFNAAQPAFALTLPMFIFIFLLRARNLYYCGVTQPPKSLCPSS